MIHEVELALLFTFSFCFFAAAVFAVHFVIQIFSETASLKRGMREGKKGDYYWLNFPHEHPHRHHLFVRIRHHHKHHHH
jgi:hypothetical protein